MLLEESRQGREVAASVCPILNKFMSFQSRWSRASATRRFDGAMVMTMLSIGAGWCVDVG